MIPVREIESERNMIKAQRRVLLLISTVLLLALTSVFTTNNCTASSVTIYVDDSNTDGPWNGTQDYPYRSIQDGINAASSGDTIEVKSGTYLENIEIDKDITITGEGKETTIIDGAESGHVIYAHGVAVPETTIEVTISGFTIKNPGDSGFDCVSFSNVQEGSITNNIISNSANGEGIQLYRSDGITIDNNQITNNNVAGISLTYSENNLISNNVIQNSQKGIYLYLSSNNNEIYSNTISESRAYKRQIGINIVQSSNNRIYLNSLRDNKQNAKDPYSNYWSYNSQGNYWDDYNDYDADENGIGDSPYDIPGGSNQDEYPLGYFKGLIIAYQPTIYPNPATDGDAISFSGDGSDSNGYIDGYNWRSSIDGQLSTESEFSSSSLSVGTHTIYFKVQDNEGTWSSEKTASLTINPSDGGDPSDPTEKQEPTAFIDAITPNPAAYTQTVTFSGHGTDEDGYITEWKWTSSIDGVIGNEETFNISDLSLGTHTIYFQVRDNASEWSRQVTESLIISLDPLNQPPIANAGGLYSGDVTDAITFDGSESYDEDGEIVEYLWDFGDETTGSGESVTHTYTSPGNYTITLTVTDDDGSISTDTIIVTVVQSSGQSGGSTGAAGFELGVPLPLIIVFEIVFIVVGISLFLFWIKRK